MDNSSVQGILAGVVGLNTISTFTLAFFAGTYKGSLDQWRRGIDNTVEKHGKDIADIQQADKRQLLIDSQVDRQSRLIELLGKRTHDLRNALLATKLVSVETPMPGFNQSVTEGD